MGEITEKIVVDATPLNNQEVDLGTNFTNATPKRLIEREMEFWDGRLLTRYLSIPPNHSGVFTQRGTLPAGVKYGICYVDGTDSTARKWIAAFDTKDQKAYAEAGPTGPVNWNVIKVKLDQSKNKSEHEDNHRGGKCYAEINDLNANIIFSVKDLNTNSN